MAAIEVVVRGKEGNYMMGRLTPEPASEMNEDP
jgi:hypothetical protein